MQKFLDKYRHQLLVLLLCIILINAIINWILFLENGKLVNMIGAAIWTILSIFYSWQIWRVIKNKKPPLETK